MSEPVLDLRSVISMLRRRRRVIAVAALVGLVAGILLVVARPPLYTSSTIVLLPPERGSDGQVITRDMVTATRVVTSDAVLGPARRQVRPALSRSEVTGLVTASSPSQDMLQIVAQGGTPKAAESLAQAVAEAEVGYEVQASSSLSNAERAALDARQSHLATQLATVNDEIKRTRDVLASLAPDSTQARTSQTALSQLTVQQTNLSLEIDNIKSQRDAQLAGPRAAIVEAATPAQRPRLAVWFVLSGLIFMALAGGLAAAAIVVLAHRDPRLRTRDEIADALGSPVIGSLHSHPVGSTAGWSVLLESYRPSTVDAWSLRQVLDQVGARPLLAPGGPSGGATTPSQLSLVLVLLADDPAALAVAVQLATHAASLGVSTRLTARQRHASADPLWAATTMRARDEEVRPGLTVDPRRRKSSADLVVELALVDRRQPTLPDLQPVDAVVLVVSSGTATEEDLARVALAAYDSGSRFRGAVVADPDSLDRTTGRLLQAQRSMEPPMPMKLVGVESGEWRGRDGGLS